MVRSDYGDPISNNCCSTRGTECEAHQILRRHAVVPGQPGSVREGRSGGFAHSRARGDGHYVKAIVALDRNSDEVSTRSSAAATQ